MEHILAECVDSGHLSISYMSAVREQWLKRYSIQKQSEEKFMSFIHCFVALCVNNYSK